MTTYWVLGIDNNYSHLTETIKNVWLKNLRFPFQAKSFRKNSSVLILPNGKSVAKDFFNCA